MAKVLHGARAKLLINNQLVGVFSDANWTVNYTVQPVQILGRLSPAEIALTGYREVTVTCNGFRVVGQGPHVDMSVPKLQELLNAEDITLVIVDRQADPGSAPVLTVIGCKAVSVNTTVAANDVSRMTVTFMGLVASDESGEQAEPADSASY